MLRYIELQNFKSFSKIKLDLRRKQGNPKKLVFIYGENGAGKSNLISSVHFLLQTLNTLDKPNRLKDFSDINNDPKSIFNEKFNQDMIRKLFRMQFSSLEDLIDDYKMIGSEQPMSLEFGYRIDNFDGIYYMEFSNSEIIKEELRCLINKREGVLYSISNDKVKLSPYLSSDKNYSKELTENIVKYWGKHSLLSILTHEMLIKNKTYIDERLNKNLLNFYNWLTKISVLCKHYNIESSRISNPISTMRNLRSGIIKSREDEELKACEAALNIFFTQLYSDVKSVYYTYTSNENDIKYELYFKKMIDGKMIDVPIALESTGTQKLLDVFPILLAGTIGGVVFIDEIDSGIHDLLMQNVIKSFEESLTGQLVATTHNTLLMETLPSESTYIIRISADGQKTVDCISEYKERTQKNNNVRRKYLSGDYDGVPIPGYLDFQDIVEEVMERNDTRQHSGVGKND